MFLSSQKRKSSLWRQHQDGRKVKKVGQITLFAILVFLLVVGAERGLFIKKFLETPQTRVLEISIKDASFSPDRSNFILNTKPILLASFSKEEKTLTVLALPDNLYLEAGEGRGLLRAGSLHQTGEGENPGFGAKLLVKTLENTFGLPIDGYFEILGTPPEARLAEGGRYQMSQEEVKKLKQEMSDITLATKIFDLPNFFQKNLKTSLTPGELLSLWWDLRQVRFDKIRYLELDKQSLTQKILLPTGEEGETTEVSNLDNFMAKTFFDAKIKKENFKVEILNATQTPGLGEKTARFVTNMGGDVINIDNYQFGQVKKGFLLTSEEKKNSYTVGRLSNVLFYDIKEGSLPNQRGDLVIVVTE